MHKQLHVDMRIRNSPDAECYGHIFYALLITCPDIELYTYNAMGDSIHGINIFSPVINCSHVTYQQFRTKQHFDLVLSLTTFGFELLFSGSTTGADMQFLLDGLSNG